MFTYISQSNELGQALSIITLPNTPQMECQSNAFLWQSTSSTEKNNATLKALKMVPWAQRRNPHSSPVCVHMHVFWGGASVKNEEGIQNHTIFFIKLTTLLLWHTATILDLFYTGWWRVKKILAHLLSVMNVFRPSQQIVDCLFYVVLNLEFQQ